MRGEDRQKSWVREFVEFALDRDVDREIDQQRRILKANPQSARAHFDLAVLYYSQKRIEEAIEEYEAAIGCDPSFARAYRKLGEVYVNTGDYEQAGHYALKAAKLGDRTLLEMFERYPAASGLVEKDDGEE